MAYNKVLLGFAETGNLDGVRAELGLETRNPALRRKGPPPSPQDMALSLLGALRYGRTDVVPLLAQGGVNVNLPLPDMNGRTVLHQVAQDGPTPAVKSLLEAFKDIDKESRDDDRNTPICLCAPKGSAEIVKVLLEHKADPNVVNNDSMSPLHLAVEGEASNNVTSLLGSGANPDIQMTNGDTPLHLAAKKNDANCARLLLMAGAQTMLRNKDSKTPAMCAAPASSIARLIGTFQKHRESRRSSTGSIGSVSSISSFT